MTTTDVAIIVKKIGVGVIIFLIPFLILAGGLSLIKLLFTH